MDQRLRRIKLGSEWKNTGAVFTKRDGIMANLDRTLGSCLKQLYLPSRGLHALWHTFSTKWVRLGADLRTLSEILGHMSVAFTMQQYVHSDMTTKMAGMMAVEATQKQA